jgi:hypothetical protein
VDTALRWFKQHQSANGSWDPVAYAANCSDASKCEAGAATPGDPANVALTAHVALAFLGAGYDQMTPNRFKTTVLKAIAYLVSVQGADGMMGTRSSDHALATMALCEAYAMSGDPSLKDAAQKGVGAILARQNHAHGRASGWDETGPSNRDDTWVTLWNVLALKSALAAGLAVGDGLEGAKRWLEAAWKAANPGWAQLDVYKDATRFPMAFDAAAGTAEFPPAASAGEKAPDSACAGAWCAALLGHRRGDAMLETLGAHALAEQLPAAYPSDPFVLYCGSAAMFQLGGEKWKQWNAKVRDLLVNAQRHGGCFEGSWDGAGIGHDGVANGRVISTAYLERALEVYYSAQREEAGK